MTKQTGILGTVGLVLVVGCVLLWRAATVEPESRLAAAQRMMECFEANDSACLVRYVSNQELRQANLSRRALTAIVDEFVKPRTAGFTRKGPMEQGVLLSGSGVYVKQEFTHIDGRKFAATFNAWATEAGPKTASMLSSLFGAASQATRPAGARDRIGLWRHLIEESEALEEVAAKHNVGGLLAPEGDGTAPFISWNGLRERLRADLAAVREQSGNPKS